MRIVVVLWAYVLGLLLLGGVFAAANFMLIGLRVTFPTIWPEIGILNIPFVGWLLIHVLPRWVRAVDRALDEWRP